MEQKTSLTELYFIFVKMGAMMFGGGYAMLPILEKELIEKRRWITNTQLMDFFAISQTTPGVLAVNTASLIGYKKRKAAGAIIATLGVVTPSVIIITIIACFLKSYMEAEVVTRIFAALRICVCVLIINAMSPFFKQAFSTVFTVSLFTLSLAVYYIFKISPSIIVVSCALIAIAVAKIKGDFK